MKKLNLILCLGLAIPLTGTTVLAVENDPTTEMSSSKMNEIIEKNSDMFIYDEIIGHKSLSLNSTEIPLYVTFENQLTALSNFKEKFSNELETIKLEMELEDLNEQNYDNYCDATYVLLENEKLDQDKAQEILAFFDIFENKYQNDEIIEKTNYSARLRTVSEEDLEEIELLTPDYSEDENEFARAGNYNLGFPSLTKAINYAKKYAYNQNTSYHYYQGKDCTNFVSQILNYSGVKQVTTNKNTTGWWYKSKNQHSNSWTVANTFSKYMGRKKIGSNWRVFTTKMIKGSFIGLDRASDGDLNHMAFITDKKSDGTSVQIAQHSTNYLKWSTDCSGWTNPGANASYYIVR